MYNILDENGEVFVPAFKGDDGKSAYEIAVENGFIGTEEEWLESLIPDIQIGTVTTLEPEEPATVTRTGTDEEPRFNFGIPRGNDGGYGGIDRLKDPDKTYLVIKIPADNDTFTLLTGTGGSPNYTIEWGDGTSENITTTDNPTHEYETAGMYLITIRGYFSNGIEYGHDDNINKNKIIEVYGGSNYPLSIGGAAFAGCTSLTTASFPNATSVGSRPFPRCSSLTTANFPNVTGIGDLAFYYCTSLTTVNFPNATDIEAKAFNGCSSLTTANFPNVTGIGDSAFAGCTSLTTASFPNATSMEGSAFGGCTSLTTAIFPKATSVGTRAFSGCTSLKELTIGNVTTTDSNYSFAYVKLVNLTIAQDVTETDITRIKQFYSDNGGTFIGTQINSIE